MMWLAISKNSWHYRYYKQLHRLWNVPVNNNNLSLCKYSWIFFILSLLSFMSFPLISMGWIFLKSLRVFYQIMERFTLGQKILDTIDHYLDLGSKIEELTEEMNREPFVTCFFIGVIGIVLLAAIFTMGFLTVNGVSAFISNISLIPSLILTAILYFGWLLMWVFLSMGNAIYEIGYFLNNLLVFLYPYVINLLLVILKILPIFVITCVFIFFVCYGVIRFFDTCYGKKIINYLSLKFNGFQKARAKTIERRICSKEETDSPVQEKDNDYEGFWCFNKDKDYAVFIAKWYNNIKGFLFTGIRKEHNGKTFNVLGFFPMVLQTIKSLKDGVCPFIQFIDEENDSENQ